MIKDKVINIFLMSTIVLALSFTLSSCKNKKKKCDSCPQWGELHQESETNRA